LKGALNVLETNIKKKKKNIKVLYIGVNAFRKALKEEKVDGLTNPHIILSRWKNHLSLICKGLIMLGGPNCSMYS
jgi:hypothetical protein